LLRSGVPLHESLRLTENLTSVRPVRDLFKSVADDALEGQSLSESLVRRPFFPLEIAWVIRNGEFGGNLVEALENAAQMCHGKFEFFSRMILSVLEPALLIAMGLVVVAIAVSLFYPLYSISKYLGV
jgi:type II secretory pathway component PulF